MKKRRMYIAVKALCGAMAALLVQRRAWTHSRGQQR